MRIVGKASVEVISSLKRLHAAMRAIIHPRDVEGGRGEQRRLSRQRLRPIVSVIRQRNRFGSKDISPAQMERSSRNFIENASVPIDRMNASRQRSPAGVVRSSLARGGIARSERPVEGRKAPSAETGLRNRQIVMLPTTAPRRNVKAQGVTRHTPIESDHFTCKIYDS